MTTPGGVTSGKNSIAWTAEQRAAVNKLMTDNMGSDKKITGNEAITFSNGLNKLIEDGVISEEQAASLYPEHKKDLVEKFIDKTPTWKEIEEGTIGKMADKIGEGIDKIRGFFGFKPVYGNKE